MAQSYVQDPTFRPNDLKTPVQVVHDFQPQPDGKIIVFGDIGLVDGIATRSLFRLHANARLDTTFRLAGISIVNLNAMALQKDGKVLVAGSFYADGALQPLQIVRLLPDGKTDASFTVTTGITGGVVNDVALQEDGKIIIAGDFKAINGRAANWVARLNPDGTPDASFPSLVSFSGWSIQAVLIQADGKVVITGAFTALNGVARKRIARLHKEGGLDEGFNPGITSELVPRRIALQGDQKIVVAGYLSLWSTGKPSNAIERLNPDGSIDRTFSVDQLQKYNYVEGLAIQPDGKILLAGFYDVAFNPFNDGRCIRVNPDGTIDPSFRLPDGVEGFRTTRIECSGTKILISGAYDLVEPRLFQLQTNGLLDESFQLKAEQRGTAGDLLPGDDATILVSSYGGSGITGRIARVNGKPVRSLFKLTDAGSDSTFNAPGGYFAGVPLPGGKVLARNFTELIRLHADGSLDGTFSKGVTNKDIRQTLVQKDGKVLVGGYFSTYNGVQSGTILRLHADGSTDNTFNATAFTKTITAMAVQQDGKIVVGTDEKEGDTYLAGIYRFNPDGSLDASGRFAVAEGMLPLALAVQPDGKLILGGSFTKLGDYPANYLVRLNPDLSMDDAWKAGVEAKLNNAVDKIVVQPDGKIIVKGAFNFINNDPSGGYVRLNGDGSIDTGFTLDVDQNERATAVALQADGKIVAGFAGRIARYTLPLAQTIAFAGIPDKLTSDVPFRLVAASSADLPVRFSIASGPATLAGDTLKLTGEPGIVTVVASQAGNKYYKAAPSAERSFRVQAVLAVAENAGEPVRLYPNPAASIVILELPYPGRLQGLQLINAQGKEVRIRQSRLGTQIQIETGTLPAGIYLLRAWYGGQAFVRRLVLQ